MALCDPIDRLTPWGAADTAFGWSKPVEADAERSVTIAATPLTLVRLRRQLWYCPSIAVFTILPEGA